MHESQSKPKQIVLALVGLLLIASVFYGFVWVVHAIWQQFVQLNANLAVGILTASTTILVATVTVVLGRYYERKKEVESHFRSSKIEMYDEFLSEFFKLFHGKDSGNEREDLAPFLREWQRKMVVWGGSSVLAAYIKWKNHLGKGEPDAQSIFLMEDFFRAIRKDLGLSNRGLERGAYAHLILRQADLFLAMAKTNPNVTLAELAAKEKELGLSQ